MNANFMDEIQKTSGRKLTQEEIQRVRQVGASLNLRDDDALWSLLAAMEYQRAYYEALPKKINKVTAEILERISNTADKEVANAQAKLTDSVVEQAKHLSTKIHYATLLPMAMLALLCLMAFGSVLMWAGFHIATTEYIPLVAWLRMPSGIVMGVLSIVTGLFCSFITAKEYAVGNTYYKNGLKTLGFFIAGSMLIALTLPITF